jgi:hypothetical protein
VTGCNVLASWGMGPIKGDVHGLLCSAVLRARPARSGPTKLWSVDDGFGHFDQARTIANVPSAGKRDALGHRFPRGKGGRSFTRFAPKQLSPSSSPSCTMALSRKPLRGHVRTVPSRRDLRPRAPSSHGRRPHLVPATQLDKRYARRHAHRCGPAQIGRRASGAGLCLLRTPPRPPTARGAAPHACGLVPRRVALSRFRDGRRGQKPDTANRICNRTHPWTLAYFRRLIERTSGLLRARSWGLGALIS